MAQELSAWLEEGINAVEPFLSGDMDKGISWRERIGSELETSRFGVVCLTPENLSAPWIHFEAGALSKARENTWTLLFDVSHANIQQPLSDFQHTTASKDDVRKLLTSVNEAVRRCGEKARSEAQLDRFFNMHWEPLGKIFDEIRLLPTGPAPASARADRDVLEEILGVVRELRTGTGLGRGRALVAPTTRAIYGFSPDGVLSISTDIDTANAIHDVALKMHLASEVSDLGEGEGAVLVSTRDATAETLVRFALMLRQRTALTDEQVGLMLRKLASPEPTVTRRWMQMMESKEKPAAPPPSGGGLDGQ